MARIVDKTFFTQDEEFNPEWGITKKIEAVLKGVGLDTYNEVYIIRITVDKVDEIPDTQDDE